VTIEILGRKKLVGMELAMLALAQEVLHAMKS
jgi:hypothetical protein